MGFHKGVMISVCAPIVLMFSMITAASICQQGKEYYDTNLQKCVNCTICLSHETPRRTCGYHFDAICVPINFNFDYNAPVTPHSNPHRHHKHGDRHRKNHQDDRNGEGISTNEEIEDSRRLEVTTPHEISSSEAPFSSAETLIWDWQAIALISAVFTCILFFLVIALYSFYQAKQWRRLKENFEADVAELSASLMAAASPTSNSERGDNLEQRIGPISDGNYINRCVYLEELLNVRKDNKIRGSKVGGNVYIEESNPQSPNGKT